MNYPDTNYLQEDLPGLADDISKAAKANQKLQEALSDYRQACGGMTDTKNTSRDRELWRTIRAELVAEIERLLKNEIRT